MATWWLERCERIRAENPPNVVAPPSRSPPGSGELRPVSLPLRYGVCSYVLEPGEALVDESEVPRVTYWSFHLYNAWWEAPDIQHRQTSIGHTHAHLDADGRFRAVIAHEDPGVPNWLDTGGNRRGFLFHRWFQAESLPEPTAALVRLERLSDALPADHPTIEAAERRARLSERRDWLARRFQR
jgi:hypothetical protein